MPAEQVAELHVAVPILSVTDLPEALDYYQRVLGFHVAWTWGAPPRLASVCRDRVEVNLSQSSGTPEISRVYFQVSGVDAYYGSVTAAGARIAVPLADRPYGMRDFRLVDPAGNEPSFGEATAEH